MIQAHDPMVIGESKNIAVQFENGSKTISLALDNSGGRMDMLRRGTILLMVGKEDVTAQVFGEAADGHAVWASLGNFEKAMNWLRRVEWGFSRV